jgi:hypothetical protein
VPEPVAAEQPSPDSTRDDAVRLRQPPGDLGRAYRVAFAETGALEVVLPATEQVALPRTAPGASARPRTATRATSPRTTTAVPEQRSAPTEVLAATPPGSPPVPPPAPLAARVVTSGPSSHLQLARRSRALLLGVALGVLLGVAAVVVTGLLVASLGLLPR